MKKSALIAAAAISALALTGCSQVSTAPDKAALHYKGGPLSSTEFSDCIDPSTRAWDGPRDKHYEYPAGQRTYAFTAEEVEKDGAAIVVNEINGVELVTNGVVTFSLNTDCETLRAFHEQIGLKTGAYEEEGWRDMLATYLRQPLQRAMSDATQGLDWQALYGDPATKAAWEAQVKELLPRYVEQAMGGAYFDSFAVTVQKPDLPPKLVEAISATQEAVQQNEAQEARNVQVQSELESIRQLVEVLGPDGYNTYQAIKDGNISVVPVPQGSSLNITPPAPAQ